MIYKAQIECILDLEKEDKAESLGIKLTDNSVPLRFNFHLEDVRAWKETLDRDYPCRVFFYEFEPSAVNLYGVTFKQFEKIMEEFYDKI
jgi:hypothetical protein